MILSVRGDRYGASYVVIGQLVSKTKCQVAIPIITSPLVPIRAESPEGSLDWK